MAAPAPSSLLDPRVLQKIGRLDLIARQVVEGFISGRHQSPYHGFSVEFAQHREYVPGDDVRFIDWKVYAKSDRFFIKEYEEETNLTCTIALDASASMGYRSESVSKYTYGSFLAASLAYLLLRQSDAVGLTLFHHELVSVVPPLSASGHLETITATLETSRPDHDGDIGAVLGLLAEKVRRRGIVVVISDCFGDLAGTLRGLHQLRQRRHEVIVFHLLDEAEVEFPFQHLTRFEGLEGLGQVLTDPRALRTAYLKELRRFRDGLKRGCRGVGIDMVEVTTHMPLDETLTRFLGLRRARRGR